MIYDIYCEICYLSDLDCVCPTCDICGEIGQPDCYATKEKLNHFLIISEQVKQLQEKYLQDIIIQDPDNYDEIIKQEFETLYKIL